MQDLRFLAGCVGGSRLQTKRAVGVESQLALRSVDAGCARVTDRVEQFADGGAVADRDRAGHLQHSDGVGGSRDVETRFLGGPVDDIQAVAGGAAEIADEVEVMYGKVLQNEMGQLAAVAAQTDIGMHGEIEIDAPHLADVAGDDAATGFVMHRVPTQLVVDHQHA